MTPVSKPKIAVVAQTASKIESIPYDTQQTYMGHDEGNTSGEQHIAYKGTVLEESKGQAAQEDNDRGLSLMNMPPQNITQDTHGGRYLSAEPGTSANNLNRGESPARANLDSAVHENMLKLLYEDVPVQVEDGEFTG